MEEQYRISEQVFLGQVTVVKPASENPKHNEETEFIVYIGVVQTYKGNPTPEVIGSGSYFYHAPYEDSHRVSSCDPGMKEGRLVIVFIDAGEVPMFRACSTSIRHAVPSYLERVQAMTETDSQ